MLGRSSSRRFRPRAEGPNFQPGSPAELRPLLLCSAAPLLGGWAAGRVGGSAAGRLGASVSGRLGGLVAGLLDRLPVRAEIWGFLGGKRASGGDRVPVRPIFAPAIFWRTHLGGPRPRGPRATHENAALGDRSPRSVDPASFLRTARAPIRPTATGGPRLGARTVPGAVADGAAFAPKEGASNPCTVPGLCTVPAPRPIARQPMQVADPFWLRVPVLPDHELLRILLTPAHPGLPSWRSRRLSPATVLASMTFSRLPCSTTMP